MISYSRLIFAIIFGKILIEVTEINSILKSLKNNSDKIKVILPLFLPVFAEQVLSTFYNMVDMIMVGRYDTSGITSIGLTTQPLMIFLCIFSAINVGTTTIVAWNIGAKNEDEARNVAKMSLILNLVFGIVMTVIGILSAEAIVGFMGGEGVVGKIAVEYYDILVLGTTFQALTFGITAALRGAGEAKIPMIYNVVSNLLNVFGNYVLIYGKFGFKPMGVQGAGLSTLISRIFCFFFALIYILTSKNSKITFRYSIHKFKFCFTTAGRILKIGIPASLEQFVMQTGFLLYARLVASLGTLQFAAHQVGGNINSLSVTAATAFSVTATTLTGQLVGADDIDSAKKYIKLITGLAFTISCFTGILMIAFAKGISSFYTTDLEVIKNAGIVVTIIAFGQPGLYIQSTVSGALRGAGDTKGPLYAAMISVWAVRVGFAYLFIQGMGFGLAGAWLATLVDQYVRSLINSIRFRSGKWQYIKKKQHENGLAKSQCNS